MSTKVLVIEDEEVLRQSLADILELEGFEVILAKDGLDGIEVLSEETPDVIVSDIMMPRADGYAVLNFVRQESTLMHTPFIFLSAKSERTDVRSGMNKGADDYITKPFDYQELIDAINARIVKSQPSLESISQLKDQIINQSEKLKEFAFINSHKVRGPMVNILSLIDKLNDNDSEVLKEMLHQNAISLDQVITDMNTAIADEIENPFMTNSEPKRIQSIYLIDDDPFQNALNTQLLHNYAADMKVKTFESGENALKHILLNAEVPDMILLDINMPEMDGWEFLESLLSEEDKNIEVHMLSSSLDNRDRVKAFSFKCVKGFICKPLSEEMISKIILK
ncbi:response regulator [Sediminitomix flava]|uniref:Response regulator receiver domain-containing protein n=1 Tax=Sediminitomix flava TaxID=379075 RepID=A0A315Z6J7_SEDFL|nr:response regulator [Sediminitomix flava]PWJ39993.1 response regulator receiver domain-containing protein [Sediminitomix flava]